VANSRLCIASLAVFSMITPVAASGVGATPSRVFSSPAEAARGAHDGATVLWGGRIFEREGSDGKNCVGVVAFPLSRKDARPDTRAEPGQIFYACTETALDPDDYAVGRQVAVAGKIGPIRERIVSRSCTRLPRSANVSYRGTAVDQGAEGCVAHMPVVFISDGHTWPDPPVAHPPEFM
jgi:hypothetical protein